jgi:hypothetical protein
MTKSVLIRVKSANHGAIFVAALPRWEIRGIRGSFFTKDSMVMRSHIANSSVAMSRLR